MSKRAKVRLSYVLIAAFQVAVTVSAAFIAPIVVGTIAGCGVVLGCVLGYQIGQPPPLADAVLGVPASPKEQTDA